MRRGFTLVEMLVVVAIIVALLALLLPSMGRAIEVSRRTVCLSNQRQVVAGCLSYASDRFGMLPPANYDVNNDGLVQNTEPYIHSFDYRSPTFGGPGGIGLLAAAGLVPVDSFPGWVHCPSMDTSNAKVTAQGAVSNTPHHSMDVNHNNWWGGVGASYWTDPAYNAKRIVGAYNYRAASWFRVRGSYLRIASSGDASRLLLHTDMIDPRFGINYTHRDGYMHVFLDGGGHWFADSTLELETLSLVTNGVPTDGTNATWEDEAVYTHMEKYN